MSNHAEPYRRAVPGRGGPTAAQPFPAAKVPRRNRRRRFILIALVSIMLPLLGASAYLYSVAHSYTSQIAGIQDAFPPESDRIQAPPVPILAAQPINMLVIGSDSRDTSNGAAAEAAAGTASNQRSDTLMLVHIPADRSHIYGISLMRDLWIDIPGHGEAKINASLAYGGVPLVVQTVESLLHQRVDRVVRIDFEGFKGLVDALGGVTVHVAAPFVAGRAGGHYSFNAGANTLGGSEALAFVRERYAFPDGDYQRVRNHQLLTKAVLTKALRTGALRDPAGLQTVVSAAAPYMSVAPELEPVEVGLLAFGLRNIKSEDITTFTLPTAGIGTSPDGQSIVLPDRAAIAEVRAALDHDRLVDYASAKSLGNGN